MNVKEIAKRYASGESAQSIANSYGVSRQYIFRKLFDARNRTIYPMLNTWMQKQRCSLHLMAQDFEMEYSTLKGHLNSEDTPKWLCDKIIQMTGMPYEQVFHK